MKYNMHVKIWISVIGMALLIPTVSRAQFFFRIPKWMTRYEIGYSYPMAWADYSRTDQFTNPFTGQVQTSNYNTRTSSKFSFGASIGTYIPVARLGSKSMFAISITMTEAMYSWDYPVSSFNGFDEDGSVIYSSDFGFSGMTMQLGLPVGADFKFGCDALSDKAMRFCGTIGAGVFPSGSLTADFDNAGFGYGVTPFVKLEAGVMAGICMKLRIMATIGNMPFYDGNNSLTGWENAQTQSSLIGKQSVTASLIFMPFSWAWKKTGWWNKGW